jgi:hypothetical protein
MEAAAGKACDVISTPQCQKALGTAAACMTSLCNTVKPDITCNDSSCWFIDPITGKTPRGHSSGPGIVVCTGHPKNQTNKGRAVTIFHEMIHKCIRPAPPDHIPTWKKDFTIPCFGPKGI